MRDQRASARTTQRGRSRQRDVHAAGAHARERRIAALMQLYQPAGGVAPSSRVRLARAVLGLARDRPEMSARHPLWTWQLTATVGGVGMAVGVALAEPGLARTVVLAVLSIPFIFVVVWRLLALAMVVLIPGPTGRRLGSRAGPLPSYTVLVPLHGEADVVPGLVAALDRLHYPRDRLEVLLVLEASDLATIAAVDRTDLPAGFRTIIVPDCQPRTKPKALAYALQLAAGDLVVVYDAEDTPHPQQLLRAASAFAAGPARLACLQATLDIPPAQRGWLAAQFALEYAALFHGLLPVLAAFRLPVPLGGTSNHFRRDVLVDVGAWDPFNVTEDADLGLRLARHGWLIGVLASGTSEEAPARFWPWLRQRTRWIKGYMQTYAVHMRRPFRTLRELGPLGFLAFQVVVGGLVLSALVHPWLYVLIATDLWFGGGLLVPADDPVSALFQDIALANLAGGIVGAIGLAAIAGARQGRHPSFATIVSMPLYWLLVSFAAYRALVQLVRDPYLWEKTPHSPRAVDEHRSQSP